MNQTEHRLIVVLGMHRSGTSALSGVLQRLGVDFGNALMPAMEGVNEKGFYEHQKIVELHEKLLSILGYYWFDVRPLPDNWWQFEDISPIRDLLCELIRSDFGDSVLWGVKDPRLCRLLPLWLDIFSEMEVVPYFVHIFRHPNEVVASLSKRDGLDDTGAYIAWLWHVLEAEHSTRGYPRVFVTYDSFLADWATTVAAVSEQLKIDWPVTQFDAANEIKDFLDTDLRHNEAKQLFECEGLKGLAHNLYGHIEQQDFTYFDEVAEIFRNELERIAIHLECMNDAQKLRELVTHTQCALFAEQKNATEQVEYRDRLVDELQTQLSAEKKNATEQIEYRDRLVDELQTQLSAEQQNVTKQVEYRDKQLSEFRSMLSSRKKLLKLLIHPMEKENT